MVTLLLVILRLKSYYMCIYLLHVHTYYMCIYLVQPNKQFHGRVLLSSFYFNTLSLDLSLRKTVLINAQKLLRALLKSCFSFYPFRWKSIIMNAG